MKYRIAVSTSDAIHIDQHFGKTAAFTILEVSDNTGYQLLSRRCVSPIGNANGHNDAQLLKVVDKLSDCRYVLSAKIGRPAQIALQSRDITPLEVSETISYAVVKVMQYDHRKNQRKEDAPCQTSHGA